MASAPSKSLPPEETWFRDFALNQAYLLMGVTGSGYLALTWSTVVLLGGFISTLGKKDFWCLTIISMLQASSIFNNLERKLVPGFVHLYRRVCNHGIKIFRTAIRSKLAGDAKSISSYFGRWSAALFFIIASPPVLAIGFIYSYGPIACLALSTWRIVQRDYGITDGDDTKANLMPALDLFYCLILCQGLLFVLWMWFDVGSAVLVISFREDCKFPKKWGSVSIAQYLADTRAKCWQDPASIKDRNLINYAVDLLDSESEQDYISGARMLDVVIKRGVDVRSLILPSRAKVQKLIDTLRWRSSDREIRERAARIVAYLASDIDLAQFPGAIRCISSLLDTTLPYWNYQQSKLENQSPQFKLKEPTGGRGLICRVKWLDQQEQRRSERDQEGDAQHKKVDSSIDGSEGDGWNELILQGLTILERLASDQHNCRDICNTPDLLPEIMAPIYSDTLIQDINIRAWKDVVTGSFRVVHRLICAPGRTGRRLRREISSSKQAVGNLEGILDQGEIGGQELQMHAIEILTELAFDLSTNLSREIKENLIKKQLQIFLPDEKGEEETTTSPIKEKLKVTAGKTVALLSKTEANSAFIVSENNNIVDHLCEVLDSKNKIIYRTIAAEILENLCTNCTLDKERVKESLLPKVLMEVLPSKREHQTEASQSNSAPGDDEEIHKTTESDDEEKQLRKHNDQIKPSDQANEEQTAKMELQEALLSLTLVMCDKLISAKYFDDVVRMIAPGEGEFVAKLKAIVEENSRATANCLRIVNLCGQIALLMMSGSQYKPHSKDKEFVESLSKASEIMSNLESCMLFAGTDCGVKKTVRPLLSDLEKDLRKQCPQSDRA